MSNSHKCDRIQCYPTTKYADNKWRVTATVVEVESEQGWFVGCTVEYWDLKRGKMRDRIAGGCSDWILSKHHSLEVRV
ncbi:MAG: hypothetical protein SAK29_03500 [Scytonema sp. PMC 1069.18]|nr:hypothetical protein [Scytonema sp. PMC 1069.18]MEC4881054.1 hypothetical protein [Scytonema sp. PMC 1070.18]